MPGVPQVSVVESPASGTDAARPGFHHLRLELLHDIRDGRCGFDLRVGARRDDGVDVIRHDNVRVEGDALCDESADVVRGHPIRRHGAKER